MSELSSKERLLRDAMAQLAWFTTQVNTAQVARQRGFVEIKLPLNTEYIEACAEVFWRIKARMEVPTPEPPATPLADEDGPGEEDGPWAAGWHERTSQLPAAIKRDTGVQSFGVGDVRQEWPHDARLVLLSDYEALDTCLREATETVRELRAGPPPRAGQSFDEWLRTFQGEVSYRVAFEAGKQSSAPPPVPEQWQPIETAPVDMDLILMTDGEWSAVGYVGHADDLHQYRIHHFAVSQEYPWKPTHWRPMPKWSTATKGGE